MFCQLHHAWGIAEAWQQSRQVLARWVQILSIAHTLAQLLALAAGLQLSHSWEQHSLSVCFCR